MKTKNIRNTVIGAVIGVVIIAIPLALTLLLIDRNNPEPVPNENFGNIEEVYSPYAEIPVTDLEGDTDILTVYAVYPHYPDEVYGEYIRRLFGRDDREPSALTLHLRASLPQKGYYLVFGSVERLEDGEWVRVGAISPPGPDGYGVSNYRLYGAQEVDFPFPVHEPGEYRLNYLISKQHDTSRIYSVSHTLTIPGASEKDFDVVTVDMGYEAETRSSFYLDHSRSGYTVTVLCRANSGVTLYQDLKATRVEKLVDGEWLDINGTELAGDESYIVALTDSEAEVPNISPAAYSAEDPFTGEPVENLFCGMAKFSVDDPDAEYRLTLEFCEGEHGEGERYSLQINLDLSEVETQ